LIPLDPDETLGVPELLDVMERAADLPVRPHPACLRLAASGDLGEGGVALAEH
jgi:hypothetical protein